MMRPRGALSMISRQAAAAASALIGSTGAGSLGTPSTVSGGATSHAFGRDGVFTSAKSRMRGSLSMARLGSLLAAAAQAARASINSATATPVPAGFLKLCLPARNRRRPRTPK